MVLSRKTAFLALGFILVAATFAYTYLSSNPNSEPPITPLFFTDTSQYNDLVWYENATGYQQALAISQENKVPMLIYAYTDWCGNCKKFVRDLLPIPDVENALSGFVKVKLNPEDSDADAELAEKIGVKGYPNLFVQYGSESGAYIVRAPFIPTNKTWKLMTSAQFIEVLTNFGLSK